MDDVTESGLPVCAVDNIPHNSNYFLNSAPSVPVVSIDTVDEAFPGIRNQDCAAALAGKSELQLLLAGMYTKLEGVCVHYLEHWILS